MRLLPQTALPHQGEAPSNAVLNEFRTMRAKRCWGRSTGQRLPPPRTDFPTIGHIAELHSEAEARPQPKKTAQGVRHALRDPPPRFASSCGYQKFRRHNALKFLTAAPSLARFVAANSAFSVFRFAKRRKPLCCRSSSPKVLRLSGSPLNHWRRFAGYALEGGRRGQDPALP